MKSDDLNDKYQSEVQRQSTCQSRPIKKHSRSYRTTDLGGGGTMGLLRWILLTIGIVVFYDGAVCLSSDDFLFRAQGRMFERERDSFASSTYSGETSLGSSTQLSSPPLSPNCLHFFAGSFWRWPSSCSATFNSGQLFRGYFPLPRCNCPRSSSVQQWPCHSHLPHCCTQHTTILHVVCYRAAIEYVHYSLDRHRQQGQLTVQKVHGVGD